MATLAGDMSKEPPIDVPLAHKYFAVTCFNTTWGLIEKENRTPEDDEQMIRLTHAATWHWTQREDCTPREMSIGYWQASRVYTLVGQLENAVRYGQLCLDVSPADDPFCVGFAYEALARAESLRGDSERAAKHLAEARKQAEAITDDEDKQLLLGDLETIA